MTSPEVSRPQYPTQTLFFAMWVISDLKELPILVLLFISVVVEVKRIELYNKNERNLIPRRKFSRALRRDRLLGCTCIHRPTAESNFVQIEGGCYSIAICKKITCHTSLLSTFIWIEDEKEEARYYKYSATRRAQEQLDLQYNDKLLLLGLISMYFWRIKSTTLTLAMGQLRVGRPLRVYDH